jgi:hypothetical protein
VPFALFYQNGGPFETPLCYCAATTDGNIMERVKYWEIIADNLSKAGWSWGWVSAVASKGRTIWIADAHRGGKRFVVHADEMLTAFIEFEPQIRRFTQSGLDVRRGTSMVRKAPSVKLRQ